MLKLILSILLCTAPAFSQDSESLTSVTVEATSQAENAPEATREIMQSAMAKVARDQTLDILGEKKFLKNKTLIERRIVAEASKFIPISNSRNVTQEPDKSFKGQVDFKISISSLRKMIQAAGLLTDSDETAVILPLVVLRDSKNNFSWWQNSKEESKKNLSDISILFDQALSEDMFKNSFYVIKPNALMSQMVPEIYHNENLKKEDYKFLSSFFHSNLVAKGEILFKVPTPTTIEISLKVYVMQSSNDREIAEVARTISIERANNPSVLKARLQTIFADVAKDLSTQVLETWQRGTLGSNSVLLSVKGLISPKQVQDFKNELRKNLKEVKGLKERIFESGQVSFEMEYTSNEASLLDHLKTAKLDNFDFRLIDSSEKVIRTEALSKLK